MDNYVQVKTKGKENIRDSGLSGYSEEEIAEIYKNTKDKSLKKRGENQLKYFNKKIKGKTGKGLIVKENKLEISSML